MKIPAHFTAPVKPFDVCYCVSPGLFAPALGDALATAIAAGFMVDPDHLQVAGIITNPEWSWTVGGEVYMSAATAGALTQTAPGAGTYVVCLGIAIDKSTILVLPGYSRIAGS